MTHSAHKSQNCAPRGESGFAMLLVFMMAAAVAVMLYLELPRVAFEAQRNREGLLIERGEQYQRAIQLYFRRFKKYPTSVEQLEDTNNIRFLRRRYVDPISGKAEWRLIHIGPTGVFTDSLTHKPNQSKDPKSENRNTFITEGGGVGASMPQSQRAGGPPRRASEQAPPPDPTAVDPAPAGQLPGLPGGSPPIGPSSGFSGVGAPLPAPGAVNNPIVSAFTLPAQPAGVGPDGMPVTGTMPPVPGSGGQTPTPQQSGFNPAQPGTTQATDLIRNLLTTPRNYPVSPGPGLGNPSVGGGIAGVASTVERVAIKIYNDRDQYNEWEFIYDFGKDRTGMGQMTQQLGTGDPRLAGSAQGVQTGLGFGGMAGTGQAGFGGVPGQPVPGVQTPVFGGQGSLGGALGFAQPATPASPASGGVGSGFSSGIGSGYSTPPAPQPGQRQPGPRPPLQPGQLPPIPGLPQPGATPPGQAQNPPAPQSPPLPPPQ